MPSRIYPAFRKITRTATDNILRAAERHLHLRWRGRPEPQPQPERKPSEDSRQRQVEGMLGKFFKSP